MRVRCWWTPSSGQTALASEGDSKPPALQSGAPAIWKFPPQSSACVAKRAEVLVARRRLGFGGEGRREHFVVLQSDVLSGIETAVVAPLDEDAPMYEDDPLAVHVSAKEAGTKASQVVLVHLLTAASLDKFERAPAGHLSSRSMDQVEGVLRTVLEV